MNKKDNLKNNFVQIKTAGESGFIKEIVIVAVVILVLSYFNIDINVVADYIKGIINWFLSLFS